jgi:hypothetical protein
MDKSPKEIEAMLRDMQRKGAGKGMLRAIQVIGTICIWEIFTAFAFPVITGHFLRTAQTERLNLTEEVHVLTKEVAELRKEFNKQALSCRPDQNS